MARYRIMRGKHTQIEDKPDGPGRVLKEITDENGNKRYKKCYAAMGPRIRRDQDGNKHTEMTCCDGYTEADQFIESPIDLIQRFGAHKFQKVVQQYEPISDGLDNMNIGQLKELAESEEIELPSNARKEDIVQAIRSASVPA